MGVDFFPCTVCSESVCDCGPYVACETCGSRFCTDCFPIKISWADFPRSDPKREEKYNDAISEVCPVCKEEFITEYSLLRFLLNEFKLTKEEAEQMYRKADK